MHFASAKILSHSIIGSLAGTSYWGPVAGHGLLSHDLNLIRAERKRTQMEREKSSVVAGDALVILAGDDGDNYVKIIKHHEDKGGEETGSNGASEEEESA